jgi:hypothetical protein
VQVRRQPFRGAFDISSVSWIAAQAGDAEEFIELAPESFGVIPGILTRFLAGAEMSFVGWARLLLRALRRFGDSSFGSL